MKKLLMLVVMSLVFAGCATLPTASPTGKTLIESEPSGAKIEINGQYVGVTPLRVDIPRLDANLTTNMVTIIAYPVNAGQQTQHKFISFNDPTPTNIIFDMNLVSVPDSVNVNVNQ